MMETSYYYRPALDGSRVYEVIKHPSGDIIAACTSSEAACLITMSLNSGEKTAPDRPAPERLVHVERWVVFYSGAFTRDGVGCAVRFTREEALTYGNSNGRSVLQGPSRFHAMVPEGLPTRQQASSREYWDAINTIRKARRGR